MESVKFAQIRQLLDKSQSELAKLLCVSLPTIRSYEQGWRDIPAHAERHLLFVLSMKTAHMRNVNYCWKIKQCPSSWRKQCTAWLYEAGNYCWFINGTYCQGENQMTWGKKITVCQQCEVFLSTFPDL